MVRKLVAKRALDLVSQQVGVVAEVALERVLVEDYPVLEVLARDRVAVVAAVRVHLGALPRDDDRNVLEHALELGWQLVDRVGNEQLELGGLLRQGGLARELLGPANEPLELVLRHRVAAEQRYEGPGAQENERDRRRDEGCQPARAGQRRRVQQKQKGA